MAIIPYADLRRPSKSIASAVVVYKMQQNQSNRARAEEEKTEAINLAGDADWRQGEGGN